ncbi:uncharacterized protein N7500_002769 [Penicillium coprophilum]|uniref:uncharacterized protein n=1 Tax=Penicillium coprophilum TaxID=36646 RepID=UPI00239E9A35|nr:uncharacterized protein N7500_002769 [Penicillium coprophilum]KAJ5169986.1 hypothetical protein N7500_002769 [Penicillium coprophilum]
MLAPATLHPLNLGHHVHYSCGQSFTVTTSGSQVALQLVGRVLRIHLLYQFIEVTKGNPPLSTSSKWSATASGALPALITGFVSIRLLSGVIMLLLNDIFIADLSIFTTVPVNETY